MKAGLQATQTSYSNLASFCLRLAACAKLGFDISSENASFENEHANTYHFADPTRPGDCHRTRRERSIDSRYVTRASIFRSGGIETRRTAGSCVFILCMFVFLCMH